MTGFSTLDRFPLNAVKPGQRMRRELPAKKREAAILAAIMDVAHDLNMAACADRIEAAGQLAAVKEQECDSVQGHVLKVRPHIAVPDRIKPVHICNCDGFLHCRRVVIREVFL
jgi:EAL domain-containing protein (putative c-di-GMP-specific phosphodiesterase class I)